MQGSLKQSTIRWASARAERRGGFDS